MNHKAMIETGTPNNHATPYFITPLLSNNSVIPSVQHLFHQEAVSPLL